NQQLWQAILGSMEVSLSKANFNTWFKNTSIVERGSDHIIIGVPSAFNRDWIAAKYHQEMLKSLKTLAPEIKEIKYQLGTAPAANTGSQNKGSSKNTSDTAVHKDAFSTSSPGHVSGINPKYTFETFIIGKNNELAHAASQAVAKNPGTQYNPLFIYGGVGLGKTHLMHAAGHRLIQSNPKTKILYVTSEKFANDYVTAIAQKRMEEFKKEYRNVDALLIDDIQFMAGKEGFQEEFFHTFNELRDKGKQIIITSDRPPKEIPSVEQRLVSRFEWGMVADIQAPDLETRMAILRTKMEKKGVSIPEDILFYIAENVLNNIRELEGALNRLAVYQQMENKALVLDQAKTILASIVGTKKRVTSVKKIAESVAEFYNISMEDLIKQSRKKEFVKPRQIAMFLIRKELDNFFPSIGDFFGGRDHTTVMHAVGKVEKLMTDKVSFKQEIDLILNKLFI
ncbi:MAG TPA: chromosomal replication initiator protein DnaA, partial [Candidatus Limnocylindria bacterium]|nr:chromosomal replication initiator protein DnaA [Candidatus Limnocylindria bacterium]